MNSLFGSQCQASARDNHNDIQGGVQHASKVALSLKNPSFKTELKCGHVGELLPGQLYQGYLMHAG